MSCFGNMFRIQKYDSRFQKLCQPGVGVLVMAVVLIALAVWSLQNFSLYPGSGSPPLFPVFGSAGLAGNSSTESGDPGEATVSDDSKTHGVQNWGLSTAVARDEHRSGENGTDVDPDVLDLDEEERQDDGFSVDLVKVVRMGDVKGPHEGHTAVEGEPEEAGKNDSRSVALDEAPGGTGFNSIATKRERNTSLGLGKEGNLDNSSSLSPSSVSNPRQSPHTGRDTQVKQDNKSSDPVAHVASNIPSTWKGEREGCRTMARSEEKKPMQRNGAADPSCRPSNYHVGKKREKKTAVTLSEMDQILLKNRASSRSMVPQWSSSPSDRQISAAKKQILNAPFLENDQELYAPAFRNLSLFKRSYELMEKVVKVYVYKEGEGPIFHQPSLAGIYASEGWFMKHMEGSRRFVASDPREAHLFYMPFSALHLRLRLHVRGTHGQKLVDYLKKYVATIAGKYPFWNRTGGADHFLVACHDWAPELTAQAMGASIRALCNANAMRGFELGKDVSLPTTYVRTAEDPLHDLGGRPPAKRPLLAFFAGQMHGNLRPLLLRLWENKDPAVKVSGPLPRERARKRIGSTTAAAYTQYMKSSRYCICPRGYEVNSPRVVEAIFYGCVPVILSDNFVPPFFEVLDWSAFSVAVAERDVPRLKEILEGIPWRRYLALQRGVRRVQRHFLWHKLPVRYDLFHMILHSVWFNRVFTSPTE